MFLKPLVEKPDTAEGKKKQKEKLMISISSSSKPKEEKSLQQKDSSFVSSKLTIGR